MIFASLKHPIRRKILRILSSEPQAFSDLQKQFNIESSHLTYHIDGLGNLLYKTEDGKYALSSLGDAAVSMMKNVEEPSSTFHFPLTRRLGVSEEKIAGRTVAIALGIICIVLAATLVGAFAYYVPLADSRNSTISSLNSQVTNLQNQIASDNITMVNLQNQIDSLKSQITELANKSSSDNATIVNLQNQLNLLLNWSSSIEDTIMSNLSDWVNRTVILEGSLSIIIFPAFEHSPWNLLLSFGNKTIGVAFGASVNMTFFWNSEAVRIYGVVRKGEITYTGDLFPPEVTYYIEAEAVEPL
jgi:DNA-binding transcriptional ArsR family regulator